jgi:hypothetical protein
MELKLDWGESRISKTFKGLGLGSSPWVFPEFENRHYEHLFIGNNCKLERFF